MTYGLRIPQAPPFQPEYLAAHLGFPRQRARQRGVRILANRLAGSQDGGFGRFQMRMNLDKSSADLAAAIARGIQAQYQAKADEATNPQMQIEWQAIAMGAGRVAEAILENIKKEPQ